MAKTRHFITPDDPAENLILAKNTHLAKSSHPRGVIIMKSSDACIMQIIFQNSIPTPIALTIRRQETSSNEVDGENYTD